MIKDEHRSILVLDGDGRSRVLVEGVLTLAGYHVVSRGEPETEAGPAERPDLILVDVAAGIMEPVPRWQRRKTDREAAGPVVSEGYAVLRALEADPEAPCHAVVTLKDEPLSRDRGQPARFGVVGYVAKPVGREALVAKVQEVLRGADRRRPADPDWIPVQAHTHRAGSTFPPG